jgi:DNA-binding CsgD family transcriptional regulator
MEKEKIAKGHAVQLKRIVSRKNKEISESKISNEKLKYSVQIEEERKQKWKFTSALLILITLSTMFSLYVVIKRKRDKQKFNKKELAHEKMRREILVYKLESAKKAVNDKNTEIESLLLNISRDNIENGAAETMMANLKDRNWFIFLSEFELIYPHFFDSISEHMESSISKNERRLCALIKLGLSNKEMSEYVFVSQESIKKAKNRFFKKFQIQGTGQEISDMIRNS